jgi:hypothetical protein
MGARNNEERLGSPNVPADIPVPELLNQENQQSAFHMPAPTEFVDLPSQGKFYPEDHPLHGKESLEIRFMTAKDEDILTSQALLRKGLALDRFLQNIIIDKKVKVNDLLVCDKNALVVKARITGYGPLYQTKISCPACGTSQEYEFNLDEVQTVTADDIVAQGANLDGNGHVTLQLPKTNATVTLRMLTGKDENQLVKSSNVRNRNTDKVSSLLTNQLKTLMVSVNGNADRRFINNFVDNMPAMDSRFLRKEYAKNTPIVDMTQLFACEECFYEKDMEVPFTTDFFWPN